MSTSVHPVRLLLVESNPADSYLMLEGLRRAGHHEEVMIVDDAEKAQTYLASENPDLIFLDLNLTPVSGLDLLRRIRSEPRLAPTPVLIVSGSQNVEDVRRAYLAGANGYIIKPSNLEEFFAFMRISYEFWASVVTLPSRC